MSVDPAEHKKVPIQGIPGRIEEVSFREVDRSMLDDPSMSKILPDGRIFYRYRSLGEMRADYGGDEFDLLNVMTGQITRVSLSAWADADPDNTFLIMQMKVHRNLMYLFNSLHGWFFVVIGSFLAFMFIIMMNIAEYWNTSVLGFLLITLGISLFGISILMLRKDWRLHSVCKSVSVVLFALGIFTAIFMIITGKIV